MAWPLPQPTVTVYFDLSGQGGELSQFFTFDDALRKWDSTYVWAGDIATDLTAPVVAGQITRGRTTQHDPIDAGTCQIDVLNTDRMLDPHHTGSPYAGNIRPGKRVRLSVAGIPIYDGRIDDYGYTYAVDQVSMATITASDALARLAGTDMGAFDATPEQLPGARIAEVLARPDVQFPDATAIDTGVSSLQGDTVEAATNTLSYLQLVAATDFGRLFASADGTLRFRDRLSSAYNATVTTATFSDGLVSGVIASPYPDFDAGNAFTAAATGANDYDAGNAFTDLSAAADFDGGNAFTSFADTPATVAPTSWIDFLSVELEYGSEQLFTRTVASRVGGSTETFTDDDAAEEYGVRSSGGLFTDLLLADDGQSYDLGLYALGRYSRPTSRFRSIVVDLGPLPFVEQLQVLALELGDPARVLFTPDGVGTPIDRYVIVEGIQHDFSVDHHVITFDLSDAEQATVWVWDDPVYGAFDGPGALVY